MRRFFVKNLFFILMVNILVKPIWVFFIDRTVQNRVGHASYGSYQALFNLGLIFQTIFDFGLTNYNSRQIAQNPDKLRKQFSEIISARLMLMLLSAMLLIVTAWCMGFRSGELLLLIGISISQSFTILLQLIRSNVAALQRFKLDGILSVTDRSLMILICGFLLLYPATAHAFKIEWFVIAQVCAYFIACIIAFAVLRRIHTIDLHFSFHPRVLWGIVQESFPYALLGSLMVIYIRADVFMVEQLSGKEQAGIYVSAYRLLEVSNNMTGLMFATMLLPFFGRMLAQRENVQPIVRLAVNMLLPASFTVAVASIFFGNAIMHLLYTAATNNDKYVFGWLMASFPGWCMIYVYSTLLTANGNLRLLNKIAFAAVVLNLSLNFYLIPHYFATGAAITAFVTETGLAVAFIVACAEMFGLPKDIRWMLSHAGFLLFTILLAYGITSLHFQWLLQLSLFGVICVVLMFAFRFVSVANIKQLLNRQKA
ncbi:MAG: oligosaccharide flippase family protein [Bacteroidetes bacterium]|nr:oligosaccharide flippase family protein [Bacteroidota bacterium]